MIMTQVPLSAPAAVVVGLAALGVVITDVGWQVVRHGMVMAHEGAHAVADALLGLQVDHIRLNLDPNESGATQSKQQGGCLVSVIAAFAGYVGPSSFGLGAAKLIQHGYIVAALWMTLFLLGILLLLIHWSFGLITVPVAAALVYALARYTPVLAQSVAAYAIAWLLLLTGVRGILVRGTQSSDGQALSQLTLIPRVIWFLLWLAATLAALAVGGSWLVMPT
jgi:Peptidase M50B-like